MKVSAEEFARGIVSWPNPYGLVLRTKTAEGGDSTSDWSDALSEPSGSLVESPARPRRGISLVSTIPVPEDCAVPEVRWTYHDERGVTTKIWAPDNPAPDTRRHVLGHGYSYRLVLHTPHISWPEDCVIWNRNVLIRFASSFSGMRVHPRAINISTGPDGSDLHTRYMPEQIYDGKFIEVIATVPDLPEDISEEKSLAQAKENALAALGLVARHLGENAIREETVLEHGITALPGRPDELRIDLRIQVPSSVTNDDLAKLDSHMTSLLGASTKRDTLHTALRWYLHGLTSVNPRDQLISHYIGVESILANHTKGLVALASEPATDEKVPTLLEPLVEKYGQRAVDALIARGKNRVPPDSERMEQYATEHGWDKKPAKTRKKLRDARNPALHGGRDRIAEHDAIDARTLLERFLDTELGSTPPQRLEGINGS